MTRNDFHTNGGVPDSTREQGAQPETARSSRAEFRLVLLNDDTHSFPYVLWLLRQEFGLSFDEALSVTRGIDANGRATVFTGTRHEVDLKRDRVLAAGPDPAVPTSTGPLQVLVEAV